MIKHFQKLIERFHRLIQVDSIRNDLITMLEKFVDSDDNAILQVSFSMFSNLNDSVHLSRWFALLSRHTSTFELKNRSWIEITMNSFRMFKTLIICLSARNFLISIMTFSIIIVRWIIDEIERFIACMQRYASKISKMSTKSSESTVSLIALTIICRAIFLLTSRFSEII